MSTFVKIRDTLPSLYRPEDDDSSGEILPLTANMVLEINSIALPASVLTEQGMTVVVNLGATSVNITQVRLRPGKAAGSNLFLEFYRVTNGRVFSRPTVVRSVEEHVATLSEPFRASIFALRLRRPGLLGMFLKSVADLVDEADENATIVLQSHWFPYANSALYHPYAVRFRKLSTPPIPTPHPRDPSLETFPYIHDLAQLASLLALPPWLEPPPLRELVEDYRTRIKRIVALYKNGLGTLNALRAMIEAQLPPEEAEADEEETPEERSLRLEGKDRPFWLEEFAPLIPRALAVTLPGPPADTVGPLMRWTVDNDGLGAAAPTVYIQGVEPVTDEIDSTVNPLIELYQHNSDFPRVGIAFEGTLAAGQTLRLRPAYASWLGVEEGMLRSLSAPGDFPADPTAPGPWEPVENAPTDPVVAMVQVGDHSLWVATDGETGGSLWRHDGVAWTEEFSGLPTVHCLLEDNQSLLAGTDDGLKRLLLYPEDGMLALEDADADGVPVFAIHRAFDGTIWIGTDEGARSMGGDPTPLQGTAVFAIASEQNGTLYFGGMLGVFLYQSGLDSWYFYSGESSSDQAQDWLPFTGELPTDDQVFLPTVRCILPGGDTSLWLGTEQGLARYVARAMGTGQLTYTTLLEAYPDLIDGQVFQIQEDERGLVWFATNRGLFRYDGRDLWQYQMDHWQKKGRADSLYGDRMLAEPREAWRFSRALGLWQRFTPRTGFVTFNEALRTTDEPTVRAIAWTDSLVADLGTWDGTTFTPSEDAVSAEQLSVRFKPSETRILDGGIPAVPRAPVGESTWRYLSLEPETIPDFRTLPAWTVEGRLIPPPSELSAPPPGRYDQPTPPPPSEYDEAVYAYNPSAKVWFEWQARRSLTVLARIKRHSADEAIDPAILDRVQHGIEQVRPAGVRVLLAVEEEIITGGS